MNCPPPLQLQHLLDEALPADQMQTIQAHLESCRACQDTIETLAAGAVTWDKAAQNLSDDPTPVEPALSDAVEKLQGASVRVEQTLSEITPPAHADDLSFLQPPQSPGSLGRLDEFEIQSVVGKGGFGIVLKAFDTNLHRVVAIKAMLPHMAASGTARQRFNKEARAAAAITHDNVVTIHAVKGDAKIPYLAMQFVSGQTLSEKIDKAGSLRVKEILRIAMQIAEGLAAAHKQGLVHRDIKPANILLENGVERVKITDFGLARAVDDASITQSGTVAGTPMYMSPEQANGEHIDHRSDLFSLGSVLYVMCTGRAPFRATSTMAVLKRVCDDTPTPVQQVNADIPHWLIAIIERLHAKKPGDRFQTAKEVAEVLGQHLARLQRPTVIAAVANARTATNTRPKVPAVCARRRRWLWAGLASVVLAWVAGLAFLLISHLSDQLRQDEIRLPHFIMDWFRPPGPQQPHFVVLNEDPDIEVQVYKLGEAKPLYPPIKGAAGHNFSPAPGNYQLLGVKNGKVFHREVFSIQMEEKRAFDWKKQGDWVHLFNGKDLTGWKKHPLAPGNWRVEGGTIVGGGSTSYLFSEASDYADFHLRVEAKVNATGDSGLFFRAPFDVKVNDLPTKFHLAAGYEAQIAVRSNYPVHTGSLSAFMDPAFVKGPLMPHRPDEWFVLEVIAQGNHLQTRVNGEITADSAMRNDGLSAATSRCRPRALTLPPSSSARSKSKCCRSRTQQRRRSPSPPSTPTLRRSTRMIGPGIMA